MSETTNWNDAARNIGWPILESIQEAFDAFQSLENDAETVSYDGNEFTDTDGLIEHIHEQPLSVEVRSEWHTLGTEAKADKFRILLGTGGPASQITGNLSEYGEPENPRVEVQDWFKPWTQVHDSQFNAALDWFAVQFYFGE